MVGRNPLKRRRLPKRQLAVAFDELAANWAELYRTRPDFRARLEVVGSLLTTVLRRYDQPRVLDLGGGTGIFANIASQWAGQVVVVDRSEAMMHSGIRDREAASRRIADAGLGADRWPVSRVVGDASSVPLAPGRFDVIVCVAVLEWLTDVDRAVAEIAELLAPDGVVVLSVPRPQSLFRRLDPVIDRAASLLGLVVREASWARSRRYSAARPHGSSPPWRDALERNRLSVTSRGDLALGTKGWRAWLRPSQFVVAARSEPMTTQRESTRSRSEGRSCDDACVHSRRAVAPFYRVVANCRQRYLAAVCADAGSGVRVLELGCGQGRTAVTLARLGADVHAIDLSGSALKTARAAAAADGVRIHHRMMDGERLAYPDGVFDLVCGSGVLHHLELHHALAETIRVLKPDGRAVFMEPLGHNPLINAFRRATPHLRTWDEHPLLMADLEMIRHSFMAVDTEFFALFALLALPIADTRIAPRLLSALWQLDDLALRRWPTLRRAAWYSLLTLSGPEKPDRAAQQQAQRPAGGGQTRWRRSPASW